MTIGEDSVYEEMGSVLLVAGGTVLVGSSEVVTGVVGAGSVAGVVGSESVVETVVVRVTLFEGLVHVVVVVVGEKLIVVGYIELDVVVEVEDPEVMYVLVVLVVYVTVVEVVYVLVVLVSYVIVVDVGNVLVEDPVIIVTEVVLVVIGKKSISNVQTHCSVKVQYFAQLPALLKHVPAPHPVCELP